ncbi:cyclin-domain-containing protein [Bimuria novae-zelandiae CBS 107.79]|uniref:Cyclin-domain-containing protein n=1 Tax=Bimuria novae-zelandiae CBS 107.79 TaxID=1447943 RepID=A0A6A5UZC2_9PLEO|nr:cyclin-domain-containing protein [Bimuria novae-zelandiae CBS 107.79]
MLSSTPPSPAFHLRQSPYHAPRRPSSPSRAGSQSTTKPAPTQQPARYRDGWTQYTPPGYPPTSKIKPPDVPIERRATSAEASVTEPPRTTPPEPSLRIEPPSATPPSSSAQEQEQEREQEGEEGAWRDPPRRTLQQEASAVPSSPAKRARPRSRGGALTVMPINYETCDVKDLGTLVSDMLMELVRLNDDMPLRDGQLTRFHSRAPPAISVKDYLFRLIVHATLSPPILLSMVFYVDKLCSLYPAFTISSLTVHRFLITSATVAAKGLSDSFWTNSLYAKVGGVSVRELALLELEFLRRLDWRIVPKPEVLVDYYRGLVERGGDYVMEREADDTHP